MSRHSFRSTVVAGALGATVILEHVASAQPHGWWVGLGVALISLWQFTVPRDLRGPAGVPELQWASSSTEHWFRGRARS